MQAMANVMSSINSGALEPVVPAEEPVPAFGRFGDVGAAVGGVCSFWRVYAAEASTSLRAAVSVISRYGPAPLMVTVWSPSARPGKEKSRPDGLPPVTSLTQTWSPGMLAPSGDIQVDVHHLGGDSLERHAAEKGEHRHERDTEPFGP